MRHIVLVGLLILALVLLGTAVLAQSTGPGLPWSRRTQMQSGRPPDHDGRTGAGSGPLGGSRTTAVSACAVHRGRRESAGRERCENVLDPAVQRPVRVRHALVFRCKFQIGRDLLE
jgi:hypothetical protein